MIRYGDILSTAWLRTWRRSPVWGYQGLFAVAMALFYSVPFTFAMSVNEQARVSPPVGLSPSFLAARAALLLGGLAVFFVYPIVQGCVIVATYEVEEGRELDFGTGARWGLRSYARLLGFQALIALIALGVAIGVSVVASLVVLSTFVVGMGATDVRGLIFVPLLCCGYVVIVVGLAVAAVVAALFTAIAARSIVIDGSGPAAAFSQVFGMLRGRWKSALVASFMLTGLAVLWSLAVTVLVQPLMLLASPDYFARLLDPELAARTNPYQGAGLAVYLLISVLTVALNIPARVFVEFGWTQLYRQLTGRAWASVHYPGGPHADAATPRPGAPSYPPASAEAPGPPPPPPAPSPPPRGLQ